MKKLNYPLFLIFLSLVFISCGTSNSSMSNMVATMQVDEPIDGICDDTKVYVMLPIDGNGQKEAIPPIPEDKLENKLNEEVAFIKGKSDYEDEGMVRLIVNCEGELVSCKTSKESKSPELDEQILAVFKRMKKWKAATMHGRSVDSALLFSFDIKKGEIILS